MNLLLVSLAFGVFLALVVWQSWQLFHAVPDEDRQFLDRPAIGFRLVWPLINALVHYAARFMGDARRQVTSRRLKRAGVDFSLSPEQFIAAKLISAVGFGAAGWLLGVTLAHVPIAFALLASTGGYFYPELWLRETTQARQGAILKTLPFYLDIITLSVEAGSNLTGGLTQAVQKSADSPLRREFSRVLRDIRAGRNRADALRDLAERTGNAAVRSVVSGLVQSERTGASLGPMLRAQAEQLRSERFQRAEKLAMEAPVKLLGPLVMFIFPTTFLVLIFLVLSKALMEGVITWEPLVWAYTWPGES